MRRGTSLVRPTRRNGLPQIFIANLVLMDQMSTDIARYHNGHFGVMVSQNASQRYPNIFSSMWDGK